MGTAIFFCVFGVIGLLMLLALYLFESSYNSRLLGVLVARNRQDFLSALKDSIIKRRCEKSPVLKPILPENDDDYFSFFHNIFMPFQLSTHEMSVRRTSVLLKSLIVFDVLIFGMFAFICIFGRSVTSTTELLLMGFGALTSIAVAPTLGLYLSIKFGAQQLELYKRIDVRFPDFYGEGPPPEYKVPFSAVMQDYNQRAYRAQEILRKKGVGGIQEAMRENRPDLFPQGRLFSKSWSQTLGDMFPGVKKRRE